MQGGGIVNEYIRYRIPEPLRPAFLADYTKAAEFLRASPICHGYELGQCDEEADCYILRIVWESTAEHLANFRNSAEFKSFLPLTKPYMPNIEEMRHYAPAGLSWTRS